MQGKFFEADKSLNAFHSWRPGDSPDAALADLGLKPDDKSEAKLFVKASPDDKLNLSKAEVTQCRNLRRNPEVVNAALRATLKARYLAYLHDGLNGVAPYARGHGESSPADELRLAIQETMPAAPRSDFFKALPRRSTEEH